jgi:Cu-Zn family superoxide dismutase
MRATWSLNSTGKQEAVMDRHRSPLRKETIAMKRLAWFFAFLILIGGKAYGQPKAGDPAGSATIINSNGEPVGSAMLTQGPHSVTIAVEVSLLPPGKHGLHIHAVGKCDPPDFQTAGGHFNPFSKKHGLKNPEGPHAGDLPNLEVGPDGKGKIEATVGGLTLGKEGLAVLLDSNGTAVVIHAGPDDEMTDPAGNSGARIACGVIKPSGATALPKKPMKEGS